MYKKIIASILSIVILSFSIIFIFSKSKDYSENENRYLNKTPKFSFNNLFSGKYMLDLESYLKDQFPLRNEFMGLKTSFDKLTNKKVINGVFLGKDNYLLEEFKKPVNSDKIIDTLNIFYKNNNYINLNLMIVPTSEEINYKKLPSNVVLPSQKEMIDYIYSKIKFNTVNVYDTINKNNDKYQMYYYLDHHWTTCAAYYAYLEYAKNNDIQPLDITDFDVELVTKEFNGTLYSKTNDYSRNSDSIYVFNRKNNLKVEYVYEDKVTDTMYEYSYLDKKDKYSLFLDNNHPLIIITNNDIITNKEIIVIKDSYANSLIPFLVNHFKKVHVIDPRYYNLSITSYLKENPNIKDGLIIYNANGLDDSSILGLE